MKYLATFWLIATCINGCSSSSMNDYYDKEPSIENGLGWTLSNIILYVDITQPSNPNIQAKLRLSLTDTELSRGPLLVLNSIQDVVAFGSFELPEHKIKSNFTDADLPNRKLCLITREKPYKKGETIELTIPIKTTNSKSLLFHYSDEIALCSWINGWYPTSLDYLDAGFWPSQKSKGKLVLTMSEEWNAVTSGSLIDIKKEEGAKIETWQLDGEAAASFVASEMDAVKYSFRGGEIDLIGFSDNIKNQQSRVDAFLESIEIFEKLFGPLPYDYKAIVEVPPSVSGFYGASEQGFILLKSNAFNDQLNSLPVLAHEAAHAWWAIKVGVKSGANAALWLSESMAQYSAVIAIEKVHGKDAAKKFMKSGIGGFSPNHDAEAYHRIRRAGNDLSIMDIEPGDRTSHYIADSKGSWIYHMLRKKIGDEVFFDALKEIVNEYGNQNVSLDQWKEEFQKKSPNVQLDRFFNQWLNRSGVPTLSAEIKKGGRILVQQEQEEEAYELDLTIQLTYADGDTELKKVLLAQKKQIFEFEGREIVNFRLDPESELLILIDD